MKNNSTSRSPWTGIAIAIASLTITISQSFAFQIQNPPLQQKQRNYDCYQTQTQTQFNKSIRAAGISSSTSRTFCTKLHVINKSGKGFAPSSPSEESYMDVSSFMEDDYDDDDEETIQQEISKLNPTEIKSKLLDLLPRMTGTPSEFKYVESYVNALEEKYIQPHTLDFLNLAMIGEWQFLFTTDQLGRPSRKLMLTELVQKVEVDGLKGTVTNKASWDLAQDETVFDARGTFASSISYQINQGARMTIDNDLDLKIELKKGSAVPDDTQELVQLIHRAMPTEMFDPSDLAIDTTYLDTDIRIIRYTGARHEGVRNIFMRKGLIEINPSGLDSS